MDLNSILYICGYVITSPYFRDPLSLRILTQKCYLVAKIVFEIEFVVTTNRLAAIRFLVLAAKRLVLSKNFTSTPTL